MSKEKFQRPMAGDELERIATRFRMLGEPARLRILQAVCGGPRPVNDIVSATGLTQANVSKHLTIAGALCYGELSAMMPQAEKTSLALY